MSLLPYLDNIPLGYSIGRYRNKRYGITKTVFNQGKSFKLYAEELGGRDFVSLNLYLTTTQELLKPCEMPAQKVRDFLAEVVMIDSD